MHKWLNHGLNNAKKPQKHKNNFFGKSELKKTHSKSILEKL